VKRKRASNDARPNYDHVRAVTYVLHYFG